MIEKGTLEIAPLEMMRGRTFDDTIIIADEMQNATQSQMKMLLITVIYWAAVAVLFWLVTRRQRPRKG